MEIIKALVSDDQELWRENVLAAVLRAAGFTVRTAETIDQTLEFLEKEFFHVVIADICFSVVDHKNTDGVKTVAKVNQLDEGSSAIVLTGYGTVQLAVQAVREHKVFHFLEKGEQFDQQRFLQVINEASRAAQIAQIQRQGLIRFESLVGNLNLQVACSQLMLKQSALRWVIMNLANKISPIALGDHPMRIDHRETGPILQRPLWSRLIGQALLLCAGKKECIFSLASFGHELASTSEYDDAMGVLLPYDALGHEAFQRRF